MDGPRVGQLPRPTTNLLPGGNSLANWRIKSLDSILATAEKKALHRSLGAFQLTMLGIGGIIGTGIFVLTAEAAQVAGPAMLISFVLAAVVCGLAALCYAELASMVPVSGSAYTYSYATFGEILAWVVGWALVLEYAVAASAVAVGWSGYAVGVLENFAGIDIPKALVNGPYAGGLINLPAVFISVAVTALLVVGTKESATVNAVLVVVKVLALTAFVALAVPAIQSENFVPFMPLGAGSAVAAASIIFFAFVGFDAVSTAAEETKDPQTQHPDRPDRQPRHLHHLLPARRRRRHRQLRRPAGHRSRHRGRLHAGLGRTGRKVHRAR